MEQSFIGCVMNMEMCHCPTLPASDLSSSLEWEENYSLSAKMVEEPKPGSCTLML